MISAKSDNSANSAKYVALLVLHALPKCWSNFLDSLRLYRKPRPDNAFSANYAKKCVKKATSVTISRGYVYDVGIYVPERIVLNTLT